jgi:CRP-like cAMP-binding protein
MSFLSLPGRAVASDRASVEEQLTKLEIFSKLSEKQIRKLARQFVPRRYEKGELLIKKGDTALGMFLISSGRVEVFDHADGKRISLATLEAGKSVGEMSLIDARPRSANVEAIEDTRCLLMTRDSFNGLTKRDPEVIWGIVPLLVQRLRQADSRLAYRSEVEEPRAPVEPVTATTVSESAEVTVVTDTAAAHVVETVSSNVERTRVSTPPPASTSSSRTRKDTDDDDDDDEEPERRKDNASGLMSSMTQASVASFMLMSSMALLTTQESFRWLWSKDSVATSFGKNEEVVSSLTSKVEENMSDETKRLFAAFQELMSSLMGLFER